MTLRPAFVALAGLALATSDAASEPTAALRGDIKMEDVLITSIHGGRAVATGRTDARGNFRFTLPGQPTSAHEICLAGPSVGAALERVGGGSGEPQRAETLVELLVVIAVAGGPSQEQRLTARYMQPGAGPGSPRGGTAGRGGPRGASAAPDLCYRPFVNVGGGQGGGGATGPQTRAGDPPPVEVGNPNGTTTIYYPDGHIGNGGRLPTDPSAGGGGTAGPGTPRESATVTGRVTNAGAAARIPPPAAPRTTVVTGTVSLVR